MRNRYQFDPDEVYRALTLLHEKESTYEIRILNGQFRGGNRPTTLSGYFTDAEAAIEELGRVGFAEGVYVTMNPCNSALLARAANRLILPSSGRTTSDRDITRLNWLLVDLDPCRPAGISSSEEEKRLAWAKVPAIKQHLADSFGCVTPIIADSGNGYHILVPIDLPPTEAPLVKSLLEGLSIQFDDDHVKVDRTVYNPSRIVKLYGTPACKGDSIPSRPHRQSRILEVDHE